MAEIIIRAVNSRRKYTFALNLETGEYECLSRRRRFPFGEIPKRPDYDLTWWENVVHQAWVSAQGSS